MSDILKLLVPIFLLFYIFVIRNITIVGKHTDLIKRILKKDLFNQYNTYPFGAYYYMSIFSYGILLNAYNESNDNVYIAYLSELVCISIKYIYFIIAVIDVLALFIILKKVI